jgi:hypothetical protein
MRLSPIGNESRELSNAQETVGEKLGNPDKWSFETPSRLFADLGLRQPYADACNANLETQNKQKVGWLTGLFFPRYIAKNGFLCRISFSSPGISSSYSLYPKS